MWPDEGESGPQAAQSSATSLYIPEPQSLYTTLWPYDIPHSIFWSDKANTDQLYAEYGAGFLGREAVRFPALDRRFGSSFRSSVRYLLCCTQPETTSKSSYADERVGYGVAFVLARFAVPGLFWTQEALFQQAVVPLF